MCSLWLRPNHIIGFERHLTGGGKENWTYQKKICLFIQPLDNRTLLHIIFCWPPPDRDDDADPNISNKNNLKKYDFQFYSLPFEEVNEQKSAETGHSLCNKSEIHECNMCVCVCVSTKKGFSAIHDCSTIKSTSAIKFIGSLVLWNIK
jgi:hypothetical protein